MGYNATEELLNHLQSHIGIFHGIVKKCSCYRYIINIKILRHNFGNFQRMEVIGLTGSPLVIFVGPAAELESPSYRLFIGTCQMLFTQPQQSSQGRFLLGIQWILNDIFYVICFHIISHWYHHNVHIRLKVTSTNKLETAEN